LPGHDAGGNVPRVRLTLAGPGDFDFRSAVCSHGFFVLAPNAWDPDRRTLSTVITLDNETAVPVAICETKSGNVSVRSRATLAPGQRAGVRSAVRRMLRLDEDLSGFHERCRRCSSYRRAADLRFGRLLRSTSLFEDIVKVICTCNVTWSQTVAMVDRIVSAWGVPASDHHALRGFPTPQRLARVRPAALKRTARVGYRADFICRLVRDVVAGTLDLEAIERFSGAKPRAVDDAPSPALSSRNPDGGPCMQNPSQLSDRLYKMLRRIPGVGDYAAAHLCMLLGRYDRLAVDTEMVRFFKHRHPRQRFTPASIRACYDRWHPYQFLAYWFDLWGDYTDRHGEADQWRPADVGRRITSQRRPSPVR